MMMMTIAADIDAARRASWVRLRGMVPLSANLTGV
jgi:hypothetical protein